MAQVKEKRMAVQNILILLLNNIGMDAPENIEAITDFVFDDVCETADPVEWHSGDVAIALRRWIEAQKPVPMSDRDLQYGTTLQTVGELRILMEDLDDHDQICVESCDTETGDVEDLFPLSLDVIEGIELTDGTIVREVRYCQRPNSAPDTREKQPVVDALIDVLAEDIAKGDTTVLDELLLRMPFDVIKYALPEDMWADFEDRV